MTTIVLTLIATCLVLGVRHRAWGGAAFLLGATTVLCGAGSNTENDDPSLTLGVGGSAGSYREVCGPVHRQRSGAITAEYRKAVSKSVDVTASLQASGSIDTFTEDGGSRRLLAGLTARPMVGVDHLWVGGAVGMHVGRFSYDGDTTRVFPAANLRVGPRSLLFLEGAIGDHFAGSGPSGLVRVGLGVGLVPRLHDTRWNHPIVKVGVADTGVFLASEIGVGRRTRIDLFGSYGDSDTWQIALGMKWRPKLKTTPRSP